MSLPYAMPITKAIIKANEHTLFYSFPKSIELTGEHIMVGKYIKVYV